MELLILITEEENIIMSLEIKASTFPAPCNSTYLSQTKTLNRATKKLSLL
jgi:hypothetical protein